MSERVWLVVTDSRYPEDYSVICAAASEEEAKILADKLGATVEDYPLVSSDIEEETVHVRETRFNLDASVLYGKQVVFHDSRRTFTNYPISDSYEKTTFWVHVHGAGLVRVMGTDLASVKETFLKLKKDIAERPQYWVNRNESGPV